MKFTWLAALKGFVLGEACLQLLNAITGLFLVRWMSVEQYAQYALANAFQSGAQQFVEFGLGGALVALVGKNIHDKRRMGRLVAAGMQIRRRMLWVVGSISAVGFPVWFVAKGWPLASGIFLAAAVVGYLVVSGLQTYYGPALAIHREMRLLYGISVSSASVRFLALGLAHLWQTLSAPVAAFLNVAVLTLSGVRLKKASDRYLENPTDSWDSERQELIEYIRPIMPGVIFGAIQSQLAIFVAAAFGQTETVAEVGALGRLAVLIGFFSAANGMLLAPFIARQESAGLFSRYCVLAACASMIAATLFAAAWIFPEVFLWILGGSYSDSTRALLPMVANASITYLNGVFWTMNSARKWIYWWMPAVSIPGTLAVQAIGIWFYDVSTAEGVFQMMLAGSIFVLFTRLVVGVWGFRIERKLRAGGMA